MQQRIWGQVVDLIPAFFAVISAYNRERIISGGLHLPKLSQK